MQRQHDEYREKNDTLNAFVSSFLLNQMKKGQNESVNNDEGE